MNKNLSGWILQNLITILKNFPAYYRALVKKLRSDFYFVLFCIKILPCQVFHMRLTMQEVPSALPCIGPNLSKSPPQHLRKACLNIEQPLVSL